MAKKLETFKLIASLEIATKETKHALWADIADRLSKPSRNNMAVNIDKLNKIAQSAKGKTLLVPGKVLAQGNMTEKARIVAVAASQTAIAEINKKGEFILLKDFAKHAAKEKVSEIMIVK